MAKKTKSVGDKALAKKEAGGTAVATRPMTGLPEGFEDVEQSDLQLGRLTLLGRQP